MNNLSCLLKEGRGNLKKEGSPFLFHLSLVTNQESPSPQLLTAPEILLSMGNSISNNFPSSYQHNVLAAESQFYLLKWPVLLQAHLINFYSLSRRIFITKAGTGIKDASIAPNAINLWWKSLLLPSMNACCALSAILMSAPPSASTARRPSCLVRSQGTSGVAGSTML